MDHLHFPLFISTSQSYSRRTREMGRTMAEQKGVLKLVHPGRHIEIHTQPILAFDLLNKYPRHCITRPDVFKFPWIVVKPDALLLPGKVFFLVPKRTIYFLIKSTPNSSKDDENSPTKSLAGMTPRHRSDGQTMSKSPCWDSRKIREEIEFLRYYINDFDTQVHKRKKSKDKEGNDLRSCLTKPDSSRRLLDLKVRFRSDFY